MRRYWPPLLALAFARALSAAGAYLAGVDPLNPNAWIRWDSDLYLSIAQRGYPSGRTGASRGGIDICTMGSYVEHALPADASQRVAIR